MVDTVFSDSVEPLCYPNTSVFINFLNLTSFKKLRDKEAGFTAIRSIELLQNPSLIPQTFDFDHLKAIHSYLFQDLYEWAGRPRSYDVRKNEDEFTPAKYLPKYEKQVFSRVSDYCNCSQRPPINEAAIKLAACLGIINIYHPFPEGNGRAQRIFITMLAGVYNYAINWDATYPWEIIETSKQVHIGSYQPLEKLIGRIIVDKNKR
ncbi:Cell filamentation protein fic [hydrothermal vent metagenome]|uniref:Cell filamentation protein fic n=1 Tax=hydrothermal vent metagenome TaxID=652676 RepID=A0A3B0WF03_9ZZZZ